MNEIEEKKNEMPQWACESFYTTRGKLKTWKLRRVTEPWRQSPNRPESPHPVMLSVPPWGSDAYVRGWVFVIFHEKVSTIPVDTFIQF